MVSCEIQFWPLQIKNIKGVEQGIYASSVSENSEIPMASCEIRFWLLQIKNKRCQVTNRSQNHSNLCDSAH